MSFGFCARVFWARRAAEGQLLFDMGELTSPDYSKQQEGSNYWAIIAHLLIVRFPSIISSGPFLESLLSAIIRAETINNNRNSQNQTCLYESFPVRRYTFIYKKNQTIYDRFLFKRAVQTDRFLHLTIGHRCLHGSLCSQSHRSQWK